MSVLHVLRTALLDLLATMARPELRVIVGGGYGIFLKREWVRESASRTLIAAIPEARATNDIDLYLLPELLIVSDRLRPLAAALEALEYEVVRGAEKYQFVRALPGRGAVKVDLLTGPPSRFAGTGVKVDARRARPRHSVGVHAHPVEEAITLEDRLREVTIAGQTSAGADFEATVLLPHPFTYLMMKLHAFADRLDDRAKDFGGYHALDLYTIVATTTEIEWEEARGMALSHRDSAAVIRARQIVAEHFRQPTATGMLRLRESPYFERRSTIDVFMDVLSELFPPLES